MYKFNSKVEQFENYAEKTGWFYIGISRQHADHLNPNVRKSFRVKGQLEKLEVKQLSLLPDGKGGFIIPFNKVMRDLIKKRKGETIALSLELDISEVLISPILSDTLAFFDVAFSFYNSLSMSQKRYFSAYVADAKLIETQTERIERCLYALEHKMNYSEMFRHYKNKKEQMG